MTLITAILAFILGTTIGSFLSVIIYRLEKNKGIILSRSICPECKKKIKWRHLIPVFSWILLRGKCAYCGKKISSHYLLIELITGMLFLTAFLRFNFLVIIPSTVNPLLLNYDVNWKMLEIFIFYIIEFSFLIAIFFYDIFYKKIPDKLSLPAIIIAIAGGLITAVTSPIPMIIGGLGIGLFFTLQFVLSSGKWIGGGDIRLGLLMGILLGWKVGILALMISYILGATYSLALLLQKKVTRKSQIPFGPFLVTGTIIALFYGEQIIAWYFNTLTI